MGKVEKEVGRRVSGAGEGLEGLWGLTLDLGDVETTGSTIRDSAPAGI